MEPWREHLPHCTQDLAELEDPKFRPIVPNNAFLHALSKIIRARIWRSLRIPAFAPTYQGVDDGPGWENR